MSMDLDFDHQPLDHAAPAAKAGSRFKPKGRSQPNKKQFSLSTQIEYPVSLDGSLALPTSFVSSPSKTIVSDSGTISQSTCGPFSEENVDLYSGGIHLSMEPSVFHAYTYVELEGKRSDDGIEAPSVFPVDSTKAGDFVTPEMDADMHAQTEKMQPGVPEKETQNDSGRWEQEERVVPPSINITNTRKESKMGKLKRATVRKRKTTSEEEPDKCSKNLEKKKFKHSSRQIDKELLETQDDEIRYLPIRDMLRLVEYKEWMEKKEADEVVAIEPPTQESNINASENQYYSQGFGAEDEYGIEEGENQETKVVKLDSPVNYRTYMNKTSRTRWSKEDNELFYEGIREFGSNLTMVQQLFPNRTREQIKLKFKLEERRYPLKLDDALSNRSKHLTHFQNVIKKLQQEAAAAAREEEEDVPENEERTKSEETVME